MSTIKTALATLLVGVLLSACGGGAQTTALPLPNGGGGGSNDIPYSGPAPRDADVQKFKQEFWANTHTTDRCGSCHNETVGQVPMFARNDDVNMAYDAAVTVTDKTQPSASAIVAKVSGGHNCWLAESGACGTILTTWIENWVGDSAGGGRSIVLTPPVSQDPGDSKSFPDDPASFKQTVYDPYLSQFCSGCHSSGSATAQQPYFADPDIDVAYAAAKSKMNLDNPAISRFVVRLRSESHNCWSSDCAVDAQKMEDAITAFANGIQPTVIDPNLVTSKAVRIVDGTIASGGNRYEDAQVALWEFKSGTGTTAFDTSGVDPAVDLTLSGDVAWFGGWGITIGGTGGTGKAQASTASSKKLYDIIQESGEFSIEAWVIPANVTQMMARIVTYSGGDTQRNFTLQQTLYNYDFRLRTTETDLNGDPALSTPDAAEVLQATLQHVVATYSPVDGRKIYVNGNLVSQVDPVPGGTLVDWQNTFALVLGNEASNGGLWQGTLRMVAIHRRALTQEQVKQNFDVGVGEKYFLLFDISDKIGAAPKSSYILFQAQQFDTWSYLFENPHFVTLDGSQPEGIPIEDIRIGMNGTESTVGQSYAKLHEMLSASEFGELGQPLSQIGAVLPLEKGPQDDQFFLTFDRLGSNSYARQPDPGKAPAPANLPPASHIGMRTFDEINATYATVTGVDPNLPEVSGTFQELRQSLPAVVDIGAFVSSQQVAIAQLAISYCDALIEGPTAASYFPGFNFSAAPSTAFGGSNRDKLVNPLINNMVGSGIGSQPDYADVYSELASFPGNGSRPPNLVDRLVAGGSTTKDISKGVCAAVLGSAVTLVK